MAPKVRTFSRVLTGKAMTSEFIHGSARNSLVWLGVAKSTHRASERVRGSGQGSPRQCYARLGTARRGTANTQRLTGRCSLRGMAVLGRAWRGKARRGKHTAAYGPLQFARQGVARQGGAWQGMAWRGKHTAAHGPLQFGEAGRGGARRGDARRGKYTRLITGQFYDKQT